MKTSRIATLVSLWFALGIACPTFADNATSSTKTQSSSDEPLDKVVDGSLIVTRLGGVGAGLVIGTPVAAVRQTYTSYVDWTGKCAEHVGGKDCGPCCAVVSLATIPASLVWGSVTGLYYGTKNAFVHGFNEPFHPNSFSLGKDYAE